MEELIEYAKNRLDDACKNGTSEEWEEQKENLISEMKKHIKNN